MNQSGEFTDKRAKNRKDSGAADYLNAIHSGNRHNADIFAVGSCRNRANQTGKHTGKVVSENRTVQAGVLEKISAHHLTGYQLMADVLTGNDQQSRQNN